MDGLEAQECGRRLRGGKRLHVPVAVDYTYVVFAGKDGTGRPVTSVSSRTSESGKAADVLARPGIVRFAAVRDGRAATARLAVKTLERRALIGARIVVIPAAGPAPPSFQRPGIAEH